MNTKAVNTAQRVRQLRRRCDERGFAAGAESLPFGVLVMIGAVTIALNGWAFLNIRMDLDAVASDYLRAYTQSSDRPEALDQGRSAATRSCDARVGEQIVVVIDDPPQVFGPCQLATVTITATVPMLNVPFLGEWGSSEVEVQRTELIGPFAAIDAEGSLEGTSCE